MNIILGWDNSRDGIILFVFRNWGEGVLYWILEINVGDKRMDLGFNLFFF